MNKLFCIFIALFAFSSCDIYAPYYTHIDNHTKDTITITFSVHSGWNNLEIMPNSIGVIRHYEDNATRNACTYPLISKNDVDISTSSGRILNKDIWNVDNWDCKGSFRGGWEQTFVITEDDLE